MASKAAVGLPCGQYLSIIVPHQLDQQPAKPGNEMLMHLHCARRSPADASPSESTGQRRCGDLIGLTGSACIWFTAAPDQMTVPVHDIAPTRQLGCHCFQTVALLDFQFLRSRSRVWPCARLRLQQDRYFGSIKRGMISPPNSIPTVLPGHGHISRSSRKPSAGVDLIPAPIASSTSRIPVRVGYNPRSCT